MNAVEFVCVVLISCLLFCPLVPWKRQPLADKHSRQFMFRLYNDRKYVILGAGNAEEADAWVKAIQDVIYRFLHPNGPKRRLQPYSALQGPRGMLQPRGPQQQPGRHPQGQQQQSQQQPRPPQPQHQQYPRPPSPNGNGGPRAVSPPQQQYRNSNSGGPNLPYAQYRPPPQQQQQQQYRQQPRPPQQPQPQNRQQQLDAELNRLATAASNPNGAITQQQYMAMQQRIAMLTAELRKYKQQSALDNNTVDTTETRRHHRHDKKKKNTF